MLILMRREGEVVRIGDNIEVLVAGIQGTDVRLGIRAPKDVVILRQELLDAAPNGKEAPSPADE